MCSNAGQTQLDEGQPTESKGLDSLNCEDHEIQEKTEELFQNED